MTKWLRKNDTGSKKWKKIGYGKPRDMRQHFRGPVKQKQGGTSVINEEAKCNKKKDIEDRCPKLATEIGL